MNQTVENILNQEVTILSSVNASPYNGSWCQKTSIASILFSTAWNEKIEQYRNLKLTDPAKAKEFKIHEIPCWTVSGTFDGYRIGKRPDLFTSFSHIIALDIDVKDDENNNVDIDSLRLELMKKPYVVAVLRSVGGKGIYVLILVEDPLKTTEYYHYLADLYEQQYGVEVDRNAMDLSRKRYVSTEENICRWIKPNNTIIQPWNLTPIVETLMEVTTSPYIPERQQVLFNDDYQVERTRNAIWALLNSGYNAQDRGHWYHCGCLFAAFPDGKEMFDKLCDNWGKQNEQDVKNTWKSCTEHPIEINDDVHRKWQGMAKNRLGPGWWKKQ